MIRGLPYDAEVEYLESTGTQWIDTGVESTNVDTIFEATFAMRNIPSGNSFFGADSILTGAQSGKIALTQVAMNANTFYTTKLVYTVGSNRLVYVDGELAATASNYHVVYPIKLFALGAGGSDASIGSFLISHVEIWLDGVLVRDMIPVRKGGVGYMYDRVSKQLFGNQGTDDFVIGPDVSRPVMGLHFYKPTAADYVQYGLVAMLDGIENAGWGVHDANATVWKNLVTGATALLPSGFAVGTDCISVSDATKNLVVSDYSGSDFTIEYVFALADSNTGRECLFESLAGNSAFRYKATSSVQDFWSANGYTKNLLTRTGNVGVRHHIASSLSGIYASGSIGRDYVDGVYITGGSLSRVPASLGGFRIGRTGYTTYQDVCCIRIYSRAIAAAEIVANYEIDKVRFGIGGAS